MSLPDLIHVGSAKHVLAQVICRRWRTHSDHREPTHNRGADLDACECPSLRRTRPCGRHLEHESVAGLQAYMSRPVRVRSAAPRGPMARLLSPTQLICNVADPIRHELNLDQSAGRNWIHTHPQSRSPVHQVIVAAQSRGSAIGYATTFPTVFDWWSAGLQYLLDGSPIAAPGNLLLVSSTPSTSMDSAPSTSAIVSFHVLLRGTSACTSTPTSGSSGAATIESTASGMWPSIRISGQPHDPSPTHTGCSARSQSASPRDCRTAATAAPPRRRPTSEVWKAVLRAATPSACRSRPRRASQAGVVAGVPHGARMRAGVPHVEGCGNSGASRSCQALPGCVPVGPGRLHTGLHTPVRRARGPRRRQGRPARTPCVSA